MLPFALNHMTAPGLTWEAFADLARDLGCVGVEYRNDLSGPLFQGAAPAAVGAALRARGLRFLALAEVKMFNDWSDAKAAEAEALMQIAVAAGAEAISLIPRNDGVATDRADSRRVTETALREILPMLRAHGLKAMVEPLGFEVCSLRYKDILADVIDAVGGQGTYFMVHDTFHHHLAGGGPIFPALTGIVHVSGVVDPAVAQLSLQPTQELVEFGVVVDAGPGVADVFKQRKVVAHTLCKTILEIFCSANVDGWFGGLTLGDLRDQLILTAFQQVLGDAQVRGKVDMAGIEHVDHDAGGIAKPVERLPERVETAVETLDQQCPHDRGQLLRDAVRMLILGFLVRLQE